MKNCPCCSYPLLRHYRNKEITWFCRHCWQEMPNLSSRDSRHFTEEFKIPDFFKKSGI